MSRVICCMIVWPAVTMLGSIEVYADELITTGSHRFWVENRNGDGPKSGWYKASDLRPGDRFLLADGTEAVLRATESADREVEPDDIRPNLQPSTFNFQPVTTYNFEVADTHSYFVGESGVWVHNGCYDIDIETGLDDMYTYLEREGFERFSGARPKGKVVLFRYQSGKPLVLPSSVKWIEITLANNQELVLRRLAEKIHVMTGGRTRFILKQAEVSETVKQITGQLEQAKRQRKRTESQLKQAKGQLELAQNQRRLQRLRRDFRGARNRGSMTESDFLGVLNGLDPYDINVAKQFFFKDKSPGQIAKLRRMATDVTSVNESLQRITTQFELKKIKF